MIVTVFVAIQPVPRLKVIVSIPTIPPAVSAYNVVPAANIVASVLLLLLQVPPGVGSLKVIVVPWHNAFAPVIACGKGFTVTVVVMIQPVVVSEYVITVCPAG